MSYFFLLDGILHTYVESEVLDVGCGRGIAYRYATRIVGVDAHLPSLRKTRKVCEDVVCADARYLPFKDESFDTVVAVIVIEHMTKRDGYRLLSQMERVSRRRIILSTPNLYIPWKQREERQQHKSRWSSSDFKKLGYKVRGIGFYFRNLTLMVPLAIPYFFPMAKPRPTGQERQREKSQQVGFLIACNQRVFQGLCDS